MRAFRVHGYEATTMKDLERATGVLQGSLHHAFGGKQALFLAALDRYNDEVVRHRIATHLRGESPVAEIRALFHSLLDEPGGGRFGCLLTNAAVEFGAGSRPVSSRVSRGFGLLREAFEAHARLARALDGVATRRPHGRTALRLLHAYQGLLVLIRFGHDRAALSELIDELLADIWR